MKVTSICVVSVNFICGALVAVLGTAWFMNRSRTREPDYIMQALRLQYKKAKSIPFVPFVLLVPSIPSLST